MSTTNDDVPQPDKRQADDSDLGPEPEWLLDDGSEPEEASTQPQTALIPIPHVEAEPLPLPPTQKKEHPWLWGLVPLVLVGVVGLVAWFSTMQHLNNTSVWNELRQESIALLPARWTMLMWWIILPLLLIYLIWSMTPAGRAATHIRRTGPALVAALVSSVIWVVSQIWHWHEVGLASIAITTVLVTVCYLTALLEKSVAGWKRILAVSSLGAASAYSLMLWVITWEQHWQQPLGMRGTAVVVVLILVFVAALMSLVLKDPVFSIVLALWFLGVAQQQWGTDKAVSLTAIVALIFTVIIVGLSVLLTIEQPRPMPESTTARRGRTSFFRKSPNSPE